MASDLIEVTIPPTAAASASCLSSNSFNALLIPPTYRYTLYPHCLFFLELLQNANSRNATAHPANKELAHRQQFYIWKKFYFWKNYRNNRLKLILPTTTMEAAAASSIPPPPPPQAPSPMQYGSSFTKNDPRNSGVEKRKRK